MSLNIVDKFMLEEHQTVLIDQFIDHLPVLPLFLSLHLLLLPLVLQSYVVGHMGTDGAELMRV